jgi:hypothetical protein
MINQKATFACLVNIFVFEQKLPSSGKKWSFFVYYDMTISYVYIGVITFVVLQHCCFFLFLWPIHGKNHLYYGQYNAAISQAIAKWFAL